MPFTGEMPEMTFTGHDASIGGAETDASGSNGAGNDQFGIRADLKRLFALLSITPVPGKIPIYDDDGNVPMSTGTDVGIIAFFPFNTAPTNYLKANGALLSRSEFPKLWAAAQSSGNIVSDSDWSSLSMFGSFSYGDGSTTFRIPKANGMVFRAYDDGAGVDSGRVLGKFQDQNVGKHRHLNGVADDLTTLFVYGSSTDDMPGSAISTMSSQADARTYQGYTGYNSNIEENRVKNISFLACIRYQ